MSGPAPGSVPPPRYQVPAYARPAAGGTNAGPAYGTPGPNPGPAYGTPANPGSACGGPAQPGPAPRPGYPPMPPVPTSPTVGMGEWLWSSIVAAIPLVGFIVLLVWAFGGDTKPSKQNWARANLILYAIMAVVWVVLFVLIAAAVGAMMRDPYFYYYY